MSIKGFSIGGVTQKYDYNALDNIPNGEGLSEEAKQAILQIAQKVAYIDDQGQTYYDALHDAFYPPKTVVLLTAVFEQGSTVIYDDTALDDLKQFLTVTAKYDDNTTSILPDNAYSLSGLLEAPSSTVTVLYSGISTTFTVAVTARPTLSSITAVYTQSGKVYTDDTLDSLKAYLVVTAHYSDSSTSTVEAEYYTLSGTLTEGTSTITASYGGKTATFNVLVSERYIPKEYQQVEYIGSSGTQYIATAFKLPSTFDSELVFQKTADGASTSQLVASVSQDTSVYGIQWYYYRSRTSEAYTVLALHAGTASAKTISGFDDDKFTVNVSIANNNLNGHVKSPNIDSDFPEKPVSRNYTAKPLILFGGKNESTLNSPFYGRIYSAKFYNSSNELVADFVPCYRISDSVIGMYERISGAFLTNAGTGTFSKGGNVA